MRIESCGLNLEAGAGYHGAVPTYSYKCRDGKGASVTGTIEADSDAAAREALREKDLLVISINQSAAGGKKQSFFEAMKKVKLKSLAIFTRQFATMINSGLSLVRALDVLTIQTEDKKLADILSMIKEDVEQGSTLTDAFGKYPDTFNALFINLVSAGEVGGVLDEVMARLAIFIEKDQELKAKVKSAMTYPTIIFIFANVIVIFLLVFILPTFIAMFTEMGVELPAPTAFLVNVSKSLTSYWYMWLATLFGMAFGLKAWRKTESGRYRWDSLMLKLPVFGMLNTKIAVSRFARTMSTLLSSGVPIMQSLEVVAKASGNAVMEGGLMNVREQIREGSNMADPIAAMPIFPPMVTHMIAVGEETGNLDAMLEKVSDFYDMEVERTLESLTAMIEPLLMVFMGVVVGFIVVAMFLPMFSLLNAI